MYIKGVESSVCNFYSTLYTVMVHISKVLKVYPVYRGPSPLQDGRLEAFHLADLVVH